MNYTLNQLRIFLRISQNQSITKTAEELYLTQPAVSIQLKNFQKQFSIPLTEVVGKKLFVTDFGFEVAEVAEKILHEVNLLSHKDLAHKGKLTGRLKISVVSTGKYVLPSFLKGFKNLHTGVNLNIDVTNKLKVIESLELNELDFALVSVLPKKLKVNQIELMPNRLFFVGHQKPTLKAGQSREKLFEHLPLIYREEGSATRNAMKNFISGHNLPTRENIQLTTNEAVKQAVLAGLGYSIMPVIGLKHELRERELQIIPVKGLPITTTWRLIWLKSKKLSPAAEAYLDFIKEEKEKIIQEEFAWIADY